METNENCPWCGSLIPRAKFLEIEAKIRNEEKQRFATTEKTLRHQMELRLRSEVEQSTIAAERRVREESLKAVAKANAERDQMTARLKESEKSAAEVRKLADVATQKEISRQRALLEKEKDLAVLKAQAEFNRDRESLQKKVKIMEHQLQKKTANELGDGAEVDLFETLREAFLEDRVRRVPKGTNGGDIVHEVRYKGAICGSILIDCKHRQAWQHAFVTKLKQDQLAANAAHAILSTGVFPSGKKEMCIESEVIVVSPARVVYVVQMLRRAMIAMHAKDLSLQERTGKVNRLYQLITSDSYDRKFRETASVAGQILDLDVDEKRAHEGVWRKRGALTVRMSSLLREIDTEVSAIIEEGGAEALPVRKGPSGATILSRSDEINGAIGSSLT